MDSGSGSVYSINMQMRKDKLENEYYYHIFSRSIAKFVIFNNADEYLRMINILNLYRHVGFTYKYSRFVQSSTKTQKTIIDNLEKEKSYLIEIVAFCLMPTHIHLLLKQVQDQGISRYMARILNCYSRFFNVKHKRIGPLWSGRFKSVLVSDDNQIVHLTRYIHLNPTSANLAQKPGDWLYSSYREYVDLIAKKNGFCLFDNIFDFTPEKYKNFVLDRKSYQKDLSQIKGLLMDNYTG